MLASFGRVRASRRTSFHPVVPNSIDRQEDKESAMDCFKRVLTMSAELGLVAGQRQLGQ